MKTSIDSAMTKEIEKKGQVNIRVMMQRKALLFSLLIASSFLFGCIQVLEVQEDEQYAGLPQDTEEQQQPAENFTGWMDTELMDVATGETFKISDFKGKPILLESFAVWCPTCTLQQEKIEKLHQEVGDAVVSISLDTDPNEDAKKVKDYLNEHGFEWRFAVSPVEVTRALIDQFGVNVVNAPAAPVILICEDSSARLLKRGVKSVKDLKDEIAKGC